MYIKKTEPLRKIEKKLFISYIKPYGFVTSSTISRWLKQVMFNSGIDVHKFNSHNIRGVSSSRAKSAGVPIQEIMRVAGWSSEQTFAIFYNKTIMDDTYDSNVLNGSTPLQ